MWRTLMTGLSVTLAVLLAGKPSEADVLHLKNGTSIEVISWRDAGDAIEYEKYGGTIRILKEDVLRIERHAAPADPGSRPATAGPTAPVAAAPVQGGGGEPVPGSPEAVYRANVLAMEARDWQTVYEHRDPDQSTTSLWEAGIVVGFVIMEKEAAKPELDALYAKHGVDVSTASGDPPKSQAEGDALIDRMFKNVKDRKALFVALMDFQARHSRKPLKAMARDVTGVQVQGDRATGTIQTSSGKSHLLHFVRKGNRWYFTERR